MTTRIQLLPDAVEFEDTALFGSLTHPRLPSFVQNVLALPETLSLSLIPEEERAHVGFHCPEQSRAGFFERFLAALDKNTKDGTKIKLDIPTSAPRAYWIKRSGAPRLLDFSHLGPDTLTFKDSALEGPAASLALAIRGRLADKPGILSIQHQPEHSTLIIAFNPAHISAEGIEERIVAILTGPSPIALIAAPEEVPMTVSTSTVGLSTVGELLLPVATPLAAGVLIATNLSVVKDAAKQLSQGKVGVPLFHTALLTCSIVTGQVLAFALTDWSLRYWQRRWRGKLVRETEETLEQTLPSLIQIRNIGHDGAERLTSTDAIRNGDRLRVLSGEIVPADGHVTTGIALVDESQITGVTHPVRKFAPAEIWAGSLVLRGQLDFEVRRPGPETQAARIVEEIGRTCALFPSDPLLKAKVEQLGDKTALPTLATAGVGWMAGSLITVGAILHQDWVSGPYLAVPLVTLQHMRNALSFGAVIRHPSALLRLAETQFLVLDGDDPSLYVSGLVLKEIRSSLKYQDALLQTVAGAALYLGDERSEALQQAAARLGLAVRQPDLVRLEENLIEVSQGQHKVVLRTTRNDLIGTINVEIDDKAIAEFEFTQSDEPKARAMVESLQSQGYDVFLMSSASDAKTQKNAASLGITLFGGELDLDAKIRFLEGLRTRGIRSLLATGVPSTRALSSYAHVTIGLEPLSTSEIPSDILLPVGSYSAIDRLVGLSRSYGPDIEKSNRQALIPNLMCVAGAFGGLLNGITSGIIANIAVANVDRGLNQKLGRGRRRGKLIPPAA